MKRTTNCMNGNMIDSCGVCEVFQFGDEVEMEEMNVTEKNTPRQVARDEKDSILETATPATTPANNNNVEKILSQDGEIRQQASEGSDKMKAIETPIKESGQKDANPVSPRMVIAAPETLGPKAESPRKKSPLSPKSSTPKVSTKPEELEQAKATTEAPKPLLVETPTTALKSAGVTSPKVGAPKVEQPPVANVDVSPEEDLISPPSHVEEKKEDDTKPFKHGTLITKGHLDGPVAVASPTAGEGFEQMLETVKSGFEQMLHEVSSNIQEGMEGLSIIPPSPREHSAVAREAGVHISSGAEVPQIDKCLEGLPECDFDRNPTDLYLCMMRKEWHTAMTCIIEHPEDVSTWVFRKEVDGKLRWRLLPIHAAIIFNAPEKVVDALLLTFPACAKAKDDQGMLPVHLSIRMGTPELIVNKLLRAAPESLEVTDGKGRTPRNMAEKNRGAHKESFLKTLENAPKTPALIRQETIAEQTDIFNKQLDDIRKEHLNEIEKMKRESSMQKIKLTAAIEVLQKELKKSRDKHKEASAHASDLEKQLKQKVETEIQLGLKAQEADKLNLQKETLEKKVKELEAAKSETEKAFEAAKKNHEQEKKELTEKEEKLQKKVTEVEANSFDLKSQIKTLETTLAERTESEQALAWQVQALAERLSSGGLDDKETMHIDDSSESSDDDSDAGVKVTKERVQALEKEKDELRSTVNKLSVKLYKVVGFLDEMVQEQEAIVKEAMKHKADESGDKNDGRSKALDRQKLVDNVSGMKDQIIGVIDSVIEGMPKTSEEEEEEDNDGADLSQPSFIGDIHEESQDVGSLNTHSSLISSPSDEKETPVVLP